MKKITILIAVLFISLFTLNTCSPTEGIDSSGSNGCGYHNGHKLYKGPEGGCYYINDNGNKTYVDREECDC